MAGMSTPSSRHPAASLGAIAAILACATLTLPPAAGADGTVVARLTKSVSKSKLASAGVTSTVGLVAGTGARLVRVKGDPAAAAARLRRTRGVQWAEPNFKLRVLSGARATAKDPSTRARDPDDRMWERPVWRP